MELDPIKTRSYYNVWEFFKQDLTNVYNGKQDFVYPYNQGLCCINNYYGELYTDPMFWMRVRLDIAFNRPIVDGKLVPGAYYYPTEFDQIPQRIAWIERLQDRMNFPMNQTREIYYNLTLEHALNLIRSVYELDLLHGTLKGICEVAGWLTMSKFITTETYANIMRLLREHRPPVDTSELYWWPLEHRFHMVRAGFIASIIRNKEFRSAYPLVPPEFFPVDTEKNNTNT